MLSAPPRPAGDQVGQAGDCRRVEHGPLRQINLEGVTHLRDDLRGEQGVPAEFEKVVVDSATLSTFSNFRQISTNISSVCVCAGAASDSVCCST